MAAVRAGDGRVLDAPHVIFPNGAVTLVLILAESDLAVRTWPEEDLVAADLSAWGPSTRTRSSPGSSLAFGWPAPAYSRPGGHREPLSGRAGHALGVL
jgi:hypothetical protein